MYKCQKCKKQVEANITADRVVTQIREVKYITSKYIASKYDNGKKEVKEAFGTEIVQELLVCQDCKKEYDKKAPAIIGTKTLYNNI